MWNGTNLLKRLVMQATSWSDIPGQENSALWSACCRLSMAALFSADWNLFSFNCYKILFIHSSKLLNWLGSLEKTDLRVSVCVIDIKIICRFKQRKLILALAEVVVILAWRCAFAGWLLIGWNCWLRPAARFLSCRNSSHLRSTGLRYRYDKIRRELFDLALKTQMSYQYDRN